MLNAATRPSVVCPYCNQFAPRLKSEFGYWYRCDLCDASVGCHKGTDKPMGSLAKPATRRARIMAHTYFDGLWKEGIMKRAKAYRWLQKELRVHKDACHIGLFNDAQCERVVHAVRRYRQQLSSPTRTHGRNATHE